MAVAGLSATGKRWLLRDCDEERRDALAQALGVSPIVARVLLNRGVQTPEAARRFLSPELSGLHEPALLPDIDEAVARIRQAVTEGETILLYGDYDADGVTSLALLRLFFRMVGVEPEVYIPHRVDEGYGLHPDAVEAAAERGVGLIVTVDCGVGAVEAVDRARDLGIDVVVTDHHEPGRRVPRACAVVNPKLTGCLYPFRDLAGVGVAFKLAWALAQSFSPGKRVSEEFRRFLLDAMGLVAIGTVADVVPLRGENRIFATYGLHALRHSTSPGVTALVRQVGASGRPLRPRDVSFRLGPRLNAAGRLGAADICVELLTSDDLSRAVEIAEQLEQTNRQRRTIQATILDEALDALAALDDLDSRRTIVLAREGWHAGVLGIVASRLAEDYHRPTLLLSLDDAVARGSARSVPGVNLFEAVEACEGMLLGYG
ncbi:MAG: single-stranded-DNA-specific exonuclease RecJ, partial [Planctomycetota bacterium]